MGESEDRIQKIVDQTKADIDARSDRYLSDVMRFVSGLGMSPMAITRALQEGERVSKAIEPLNPLMSPVFDDPASCEAYDGAASRITSVAPSLGISNDDTVFALGILRTLHSKCPDPNRHPPVK